PASLSDPRWHSGDAAGRGPPSGGRGQDLAQAVSRDDDPDRRALTAPALDLAEPAEERDALAHPKEPEVARPHAGLAPLLGLEAVPVVGDVDLERVLGLEQREPHLVRGGMLLHVVQCLHRDAIESRLRFARERPRVVERLLQGPTRVIRHLARRGRERGDEAETVERRGADGAEGLTRLADRAAQQLRRLVDLFVLDVRALQLCVRRDEDRSKSVVEIAREPAALLLLL